MLFLCAVFLSSTSLARQIGGCTPLRYSQRSRVRRSPTHTRDEFTSVARGSPDSKPRRISIPLHLRKSRPAQPEIFNGACHRSIVFEAKRLYDIRVRMQLVAALDVFLRFR